MNRDIILKSMLLVAALAGLARAQVDPEAEKIRKLVVKIQKEMKEVDQLLLRADRPSEAASKIDETIKNIQDLLKSTEQKQSDVIKGIEELVRLAKYQQSQQSSSQRDQQKPQKPDGQDEQEQKRPKDPEPQELQKQQGQGQDQPKDQQEQETTPEQKRANRLPPGSEKGQFVRPDLKDRWGVLPSKEQEDLINAMSSRIPERYRRWIEEYYRRVSKSKR
jgi:hypothetical protein